MRNYYDRSSTPDDDPRDPAHVATVDQQHAMFRDFANHLAQHCREALAQGFPAQAVALQMASELDGSDHTRETFACLLGIALTDLARSSA